MNKEGPVVLLCFLSPFPGAAAAWGCPEGPSGLGIDLHPQRKDSRQDVKD